MTALMDSDDVTERGVRPFVPAMSEIIDWLVGDECHELDDAEVTAELGRRLRATGLPLDHLGLYFRTLHPEIRGRTIAWAPDEPVQIHDRQHGVWRLFVAANRNNPIRRVLETQEPIVLRVNHLNDATWTHIDIFEGRELVEFVILPLRNADASSNAVSFATRRSSGFSVAERAAFARIAPALRNVCELRTLRSAEQALLDTYVGALTARRILKGHIRRGEVETLAFMLCDLRGFTELSNRLPSQRVLQLLDAYFDCVVPAINQTGGEVIKFMGDAVLAFFSFMRGRRECVRRWPGGRPERASAATGACHIRRRASRRHCAPSWQGKLRQHRLRPPTGFHVDRSGRQFREPIAGGLQHHRSVAFDVGAVCAPARSGPSHGARTSPAERLCRARGALYFEMSRIPLDGVATRTSGRPHRSKTHLVVPSR